MNRSISHKAARLRGLTMIELMMALAGTAVVGVAITAMLSAVSYGTNTRNDMRSALVRQSAVGARLTAAIRGSRMVLDADDDYLILWVSDDNENDAPNLSELRFIELDATGKQLLSYRADFSGMTEAEQDAADTEYDLNDDFRSIVTALAGDSTFPEELWATNVTSLTIELNNSDAQEATAVEFRINMGSGASTHTAIGSAALRNQETAE